MRLAALLLATALSLPAAVGPTMFPEPRPDLIGQVAGMAGDPVIREACRRRGLDILNLTWEDTGRWKGSAVGPNISDLTIQPWSDGPARRGRADPLLPVIRYPNFADLTADLPIDDLRVLVGNHRGEALRPVTLREYLQGFRGFQHAPTGSMTGELLAARDRVVLTSAQACILPVPAGGSVRFSPVLFNYQSAVGAPAVLVILATPEGTSAQVVENNPELSAGYAWGQRLFHNADGQRAGLLATRFSDRGQGAPATAGNREAADGLSCVLVIQVPLVVDRPVRAMEDSGAALSTPCAPAACAEAAKGMEQAVVQAGPVEGPWLGLHGCHIRRDERFPIRATVQFYQATDTPRVAESDLERLARTIHRVYARGEAVGSLVTAGWTARATEHAQPQPPVVQPWPQPWWGEPCRAWERDTGRPWAEGLARIRARLGLDWQPADARELANALTLVR